MDFLKDLLAAVVLGKDGNDRSDSDTVLSVVTAVIVVFAVIGANHVWHQYVVAPFNSNSSSSNRNGATSRRTASDTGGGTRISYRRQLRTLLLGGLACCGPRLYRSVSSRPEFVTTVDTVLDGCQNRLREMVVSTTSLKDDALLDTLDGFLDGFQSWLKKELLSGTAATAGGEAEGDAQRRRNP